MKTERLIPAGLVLVLALQGLAMAFFLFDAADELSHDPSGLHPLTEGLTAVALGAGILLVGRALLRSLHHARQHKSALAIASGEFRRVIEAEFDLWHLTPAERAVALLSLRGFELDKIAELRGSALGTVRAQLAKIYAKSGTANRAQLSAVFVERLMGGPPPPP
jgi:DNA-binding NarL/FixJ family response regulator